MARITKFDAPIPGESMTLKPKTYPFDRPPKHSNPEDAADDIFEMITEEKAAKSLLLLLDSGMPVSFIAKYVLQRAFGEGIIGFDMIPLVAGPVGVMITAMAQGANIEPKMEWEKDDSIAKIVARMKSNNIDGEDVADALEEARDSKQAGAELGDENGPGIQPMKKGGKGLGSRNN